MDTDLLDGVLDLEEKFYAEGHELGTNDGARAGYNEGTVFAVEKGFEKFQEMGRLYGKGIIWSKRLPGHHGLLHPTNQSSESKATKQASSPSNDTNTTAPALEDLKLANLPGNPRLEKHLTTFLTLVDPTTLSMENTEEAVAEFDDRLKKATAKAKVIERIIGEQSEGSGRGGHRAADQQGSNDNIEDIGPLPPRLAQNS